MQTCSLAFRNSQFRKGSRASLYPFKSTSEGKGLNRKKGKALASLNHSISQLTGVPNCRNYKVSNAIKFHFSYDKRREVSFLNSRGRRLYIYEPIRSQANIITVIIFKCERDHGHFFCPKYPDSWFSHCFHLIKYLKTNLMWSCQSHIIWDQIRETPREDSWT